ncbi:MAG: Crp/Fnr family transcriptional regulator [Roseiflexaceae bacterium]|nr:Crp/Fnr family transcriptional regulator [Roseiflexaceae bacterium]
MFQAQEVERFAKGSVIYTPAHEAEHVLLLTDGSVGLYILAPEGRTLMLRVVEPGQLFGHAAVAERGLYDTYAQAQGPVRLTRLGRSELRGRVAEEPQLGLALLDDLQEHRLGVSRLLDEVAFKSVPARLASLLLEMAQRHGAPSLQLPRHSHRQLAEMVNAYRETVTKVINEFRNERLLEIDRTGIRLINLLRLEELAQGW